MWSARYRPCSTEMNSQSPAMQDQRWRGDECELVANIGLSEDLAHRARHTRRRRAVACVVPPRPERLIACDGRGDAAQHVEALLDRVGLDTDRLERIHPARVGAGRVVGRPPDAGRAVNDHQASHALGMLGGQHESAHRGVPGAEDRRLLAPDRIHHGDRVLGPELRTDLVQRCARGQAHSALVKPDHPGERCQPPVEAI